MKKCGVCRTNLGFIANKYKCFDGYVCNNCYEKADIHKQKNKITVEEFKDKIFSINRKKEKTSTTYNSRLEYFDKSVGDYFYVDTKNNRFLMKGCPIAYDYKHLVSYSLHVEDGQQETKKGSVSRAIIGGAIAGCAGAIVGAHSAKSEITDIITYIYVCVTTKDMRTNNIVLLNTPTKKNSTNYINAINYANKIIGMLDIIKISDI